ncbi:MAG TPA: 2-oxoglutarate dehydrogenase E1 component, partial [Stellaceae bacterium]|nr:2-oxoglutarate dehydrogenase E1 component [Stellaceae bacterium]
MPPLVNQTFLNGQNAAFIAELYGRYLADPQSVDPSWQGFFAELGEEPKAFLKEMEGPGWGEKRPAMLGNGHLAAPAIPATVAALPADVHQAAFDSIRAMNFIRSYRVRGHLIAELDPLGLDRRTYHPDLDPATFGFTEADYDRPIFVNNLLGFETATIRELLVALRATYCGHVGVEYMHIQ